MNFNPNKINFERPKRFVQDIERQDLYLEKIKKQSELYTPKEKDFIDLYGEEEVLQDLREVEIREAQMAFANSNLAPEDFEIMQKCKRTSDIYEGVIIEQAEQNDWFGEGTSFYPTSKYDDIVNGVDGIVEFSTSDRKEHSAISFDVAFSSNADRIIKKLERTKKTIRDGHLTEIKYFQGEDGEKKKIFAPRIVLGSRLSSAEKLIDLWGSKTEGKQAKLAEHPIQIKLLLEAYLQLNHFALYANEIGEREIAEQYNSMGNIIADIINAKNELLQKHYNEISDDIVFETIKNYCDKVEI